jgi:hypothetical protein
MSQHFPVDDRAQAPAVAEGRGAGLTFDRLADDLGAAGLPLRGRVLS